jgi:protein-L-isoaspartate(D-aspartate) O-methyltransferase
MNDVWLIPPPSQPVKRDEDLRREREAKIGELERRGLLRSERLRRAMLNVPREDFIPPRYRDHAYEEIPLPLPGERATISCPHSYPLFYEPLGLGKGHRFLEVGVGSGYGTSLAREVVGRDGLVVGIDIDATTLAFARENLERAGYTDVVLIHGDGGLGDAEHAPYERICVTAACPDVPPPLIEQLAVRGRLIAPVIEGTRQRLTLLDKTMDGVRRTSLVDVLYVSAGTVRRRQRSIPLSWDDNQRLGSPRCSGAMPRVRRRLGGYPRIINQQPNVTRALGDPVRAALEHLEPVRASQMAFDRARRRLADEGVAR